MIFRQLFDPETSSYSYLLADSRTKEAVLIDPVREQVERDARVIRELGLKLLATLETHTHADHVTGAALLKDQFGSDIIVPAKDGAEGADQTVDQGDVVVFGDQRLEVRATPGHTRGSVTFVCGDLSRAFTGDALMIRGCGRTDFQGGDARTLYKALHEQVLTLPGDTLVYPAHDYHGHTVSTVREERVHNPRLGEGKSEDDFVDIMANLDLSYPERIDVALPANQALGRLPGDPGTETVVQSAWDEVTRSGTGVPQVTTAWVAEHGDEVKLVDVRSAQEFTSDVGHIDGAELVPLGTLVGEAEAWDSATPIVTICRSGGRSDRAAAQLERMGFSRVASMTGGMMAWNRDNRPTSTDGGDIAACG